VPGELILTLRPQCDGFTAEEVSAPKTILHEIRSTVSRSGDDEELLLDEQILANEGLGAARTEPPSDSGQEVDEE